jgi:hypothetical protein
LNCKVLFLALRMPLDGIVPQIMSLPPHMLEAKPADPVAGRSWQYPPVYFVHMEMDRATAQRVAADINVLKTKQVAAKLTTCVLYRAVGTSLCKLWRILVWTEYRLKSWKPCIGIVGIEMLCNFRLPSHQTSGLV